MQSAFRRNPGCSGLSYPRRKRVAHINGPLNHRLSTLHTVITEHGLIEPTIVLCSSYEKRQT